MRPELAVVLLVLLQGGPEPRVGTGAPDVDIRYPARNQLVAPDSNFIFGSVGSGDVALAIDGAPVEVEANGAFLAWLPVPDADGGEIARYGIVAVQGLDTTTVSYPIRRPPSGPPAGEPSPWLRTAEFERPVERWYGPGDVFPLFVTGEEGVGVHLEAGALRVPLIELGEARGSLRRYGALIDPARLREAACAAEACRAGVASLPTDDPSRPLEIVLDTVDVVLEARAGTRVRRFPVSFHLAPRPDPAPLARLREAADPVNGSSGVVVGRPTAFGPYRWRFPDGTVAPAAGRVGPRVGLDLGDGPTAWVAAEDVVWERPTLETGPARVLGARGASSADGADFRVGVSRAAPTRVVVTGPRTLRLTIYDSYGELGRVAHGADSGVERVEWSQESGPAVHIDVTFRWPLWGNRLTVERGDPAGYEGPGESAPPPPGAGEGGAVLRLAVRRAPHIDPDEPLRGRTIAIDAGHPGGGSYGPTGLYEGDVNLAISRRLAERLRDAGAEPIMIRGDRSALGLYERTQRARDGGAELFVSIHNNAVPDGVRPFERAGTATFYYHALSAPLAAAVQAGMVEHMGLRDLGVLWGDLAVAREPWMPAILAEGAFMMIPAHEAALRTPEFQDRYARGVAEGIADFLRDAAERP